MVNVYAYCFCILYVMLLYCFQVIFYKQNAYPPNGKVLFKSFPVWPGGHWKEQWPRLDMFPSIQVWGGRYPHHQSCFIVEDIGHKENSPPHATNHLVQCVSSFQGSQIGFRVVFHPMIDIQLLDEFRNPSSKASFQCLPHCSHQMYDWTFSWSAFALIPFFRTIVLHLNLTYFLEFKPQSSTSNWQLKIRCCP